MVPGCAFCPLRRRRGDSIGRGASIENRIKYRSQLAAEIRCARLPKPHGRPHVASEGGSKAGALLALVILCLALAWSLYWLAASSDGAAAGSCCASFRIALALETSAAAPCTTTRYIRLLSAAS